MRATAIPADPCTGARKAGYRAGADSPRGIDRGQSVRARVPPGGRATGGDWSLPANWLGSESLRRFGPSPAGHASFRYASLRATCGVPSMNRVRRVQGEHVVSQVRTLVRESILGKRCLCALELRGFACMWTDVVRVVRVRRHCVEACRTVLKGTGSSRSTGSTPQARPCWLLLDASNLISPVAFRPVGVHAPIVAANMPQTGRNPLNVPG